MSQMNRTRIISDIRDISQTLLFISDTRMI